LSFVVHTVDLREFLEGSLRERQSFSRQLGESLKNTGFVKVSGHSITSQRLDNAYQDIKCFFALPDSTKNQYVIQGSGGARGYTSFGQEHAKDNPIPDLKIFGPMKLLASKKVSGVFIVILKCAHSSY